MKIEIEKLVKIFLIVIIIISFSAALRLIKTTKKMLMKNSSPEVLFESRATPKIQINNEVKDEAADPDNNSSSDL